MTTIDLGSDPSWVPDACTLPTVERPLRLAELDDLFTAVVGVDRATATRATLTLAAGAGLAGRAQDLADRETACCSFFTITITPGAPGTVRMGIAVPEAHAAVLAALVDRAEQRALR